MKKIAVSSLVSLFVLSCSVYTPNNSTQDGRIAYAPTNNYSPVKEDFTALAKKYNFAELEKEYKSFSTKALADTYVKKMFNKFLIVTPNSVQVIRQVEFSRYLKNNGDTSYETSLKNIFTDTPVLYTTLTVMPAVQSKMTSESGTFGFYILGVSPNQTVPNALPATNITETSFTANWSAVTGATSYILIVNDIEITGITGTSHTLNSLTAGSNHKYSIKAITSGVAGAVSNEINVNTVLTAPVASSATGITQTSFTANWSAVSGATSYTLVFNGTETTGITGTSHTINSLTPGTSYSYYVKAVNANTESVNSGTINTVTIPTTPTASAATGITTSGFTANWSSVVGATDYSITIPGKGTFNIGNSTSYNVTSLTAETNYSYYVNAINSSGTSGNSNTVNITTTPDIISGLVAYYPFSGNANDGSGNNNNATVFGSTLSNDRFENANKAYSFDGINDYIQVNNPLYFSQNFTISSWVKIRSIKKWSRLFDFSSSNGTCNPDMLLLAFSLETTGRVAVEIHNNSLQGGIFSSSDALPLNTWVHLTYAISNKSLKVYKNGSLWISGESTQGIPEVNLLYNYFGKSNCPVDDYADGVMDDIRIYNRTLTESQIQALNEL